MRTLAILAIAFWLLTGVVFEDWKRHVVYPERSFSVRFTTALFELTFLALAILVIVRST